MVEIVTPVADAYGARIEPAELCKLLLHACCLCFVLGSVYLRRSGLGYSRRERRL
jgi:hypothetical protein